MTLHQLRKQSGLSWRQVVEAALLHDPNFPKTAPGLSCIEKRGTENYYQIKALAEVYGLPMAEMVAIAAPKSRALVPENITHFAENALTTV